MRTLIIILIASFTLAGCGDQKPPSIPKNNQESSALNTDDHTKDMDRQEEKVEPEQEIDNNAEKNEELEAGTVEPKYMVNDVYSIVPISDANPKVVLLTIDDAPDQYALEMAKTLKKLDASAIFFVNGHLIDTSEKEKIIKEIYELGFEIGNHTYSHADLTTLSAKEQEKEILSVNEKIEVLTGERPKFFRAPFGKNTDVSKKIAENEQMLLMNWSFGYDWNKEYMTKESIADIMVNTELLVNGANLLMHDREWTNAALEEIVIGLREKGYETVDPSLIKTQRDPE
ncbi:polysaccharide deacetylase family protein [Bacillus niameyensis]|uniref:polysaccharide deacetylase family protein n=1 Tax=Bacillus niameyensis TaxID=1522308 RepID=UPI000784CFE1|nr:polysaccharide deacetylase family protein [Bacillus niameyensis]